MKVQFISATHRFGTSYKKSSQGTQYNICNLAYAIPVKPVSTPNMTFHGHGAEIREIGLSETAISSFETVEVGQVIELNLSPDPVNPRNNIVTGWKPSKEVN